MPEDKEILKNHKAEKEFELEFELPEEAEKAPEKEQRPEMVLEKKPRLDDLGKYRLPEEKISEGLGVGSSRQIQSQHAQRQKDIENILAEDLENFFLEMPKDRQQEFKEVGEETAKEINNLLDKAKVSLKKVVELIRRWLLLIPGVSKYFLEQEAKIKADEIIKLNKT